MMKLNITLDVWKLSPAIPSTEVDVKLGHVQSPEGITGAIKLHPFDELSQHFSLPLPKHLHIVVKLPHIYSRSFKQALLPSYPYAPLNASP